ncbi:MAG: Mini-ribonuclease 3 [Bacilli bacterium]|nr:Mini-ribonuclease 3 [Bacilli bacterium]
MIDDIINFSIHYYGEYKAKKIQNYNVQTPEEILKLKQRLNREKDQKDIKILKEEINKKNINSLSLAYLGDAVYELYIRKHLLKENLKVNELQKKSIDYVSAKSQSKYLDKLIENNILIEEEKEIIKRARNHKSHPSKSADIITYKKSTGLEALIGYLEITNNQDRIKEIMKYIVGE